MKFLILASVQLPLAFKKTDFFIFFWGGGECAGESCSGQRFSSVYRNMLRLTRYEQRKMMNFQTCLPVRSSAIVIKWKKVNISDGCSYQTNFDM